MSVHMITFLFSGLHLLSIVEEPVSIDNDVVHELFEPETLLRRFFTLSQYTNNKYVSLVQERLIYVFKKIHKIPNRINAFITLFFAF